MLTPDDHHLNNITNLFVSILLFSLCCYPTLASLGRNSVEVFCTSGMVVIGSRRLAREMSKRDSARVKGMMMGVGPQRKEKSKYGCSEWHVTKPGQNLTILQSPNATFVLELSLVNDSNNTVSCVASVQHAASGLQVWVANFYNTTNSSYSYSAGNLNCSLVLGGNGNLIMMMMENNNTMTTTWSSNTGSEGVTAMQLLENGNLVLSATTTKSTVEKNNSGAVVWQSFDYPTDTIITGQQLKNTSYMYAAMSTRAHLSGEMYSLRVQTYTNDLSLFVDFNPPSDYLLLPIPAANESFGANRYWTANTEFMMQQDAWVCCGGSYAELNNGLTVYDSQGDNIISTSSNNLNPNLTFLEYARVLPDGNLQSFVFRDGQWKLNFEALTNLCRLPNACGSYGICDEEEAAAVVAGVSSSSSKSFCHGCPPGFHAINQTDLSMGCEALEVLVESCTTAATPAGVRGRASSPAIELVNLTGVSNSALLDYYYFGTPAPVYPYLQVDLDHGAEACESLCESNCSCSAALYNPDAIYNPGFSACFLLPSALGTLMQSPSYANQTLFIKIPKGSPLDSSSLSTQKKAAIGVAAGVMAVLLVLLSAIFLHRRRMQQAQQEMAEDESFLETLPGLPPRFSYKELMIATSNFSKKLGKGGFGSVYEGWGRREDWRTCTRVVALASFTQQACLNMILVALWCIQEEMSLRPTMGTVLKMLEGDADIVDPPVCSYFFIDSWLGSPSAAASSSSSSGGGGGATSSSTADEVQIAFTSTQESQITEVVPR
ncbi:unnamed protein product [Sphagnum jensenii]|uniref:Bulb-type lectin domain-containing protein n=1 Tax=Sphagnum jensenii TaxID=128206 RepID=A0ABP1AXL1_9BRYO